MKSVQQCAELGVRPPLATVSILNLSLFFLLATSGAFGQGVICLTAEDVTPGNHNADGPNSGTAVNLCTFPTPGIATDADWYKYTPPGNGYLTISSCFGGADTRLSVFSGTCGSLTCYASNDDACLTSTSPFSDYYASKIENLFVNAGETYYIQWDDQWSSSGFGWSLAFIAAPPANDNPCTAFSAECGTTQSGTTFNATQSVYEYLPCNGAGSGEDVFYLIVPQTGDEYTVSVTESSMDAVLSAFSGTCFEIVTPIACSDNFGAWVDESITFTAQSNAWIWIRVFDFNQDGGTFNLNISCAENEVCDDALSIVVDAPPIAGSNMGAIHNDGYYTYGCGDTDIQHGVWYEFYYPNNDVEVTIEIFAATFDTQIQLYNACHIEPGGSAIRIVCDDNSGEGLMSKIVIPCETLIENMYYYISVDGIDGQKGAFDISVTTNSCLSPVNDLCSNQIPLTINPPGDCPANQVMGTTSGAIFEILHNCVGAFPDVFYSVHTGSLYDSLSLDFSMLSAVSLHASIMEDCDSSAIYCAYNPNIDFVFPIEPNTTYYFQIASYNGYSAGTFNICIEGVYSCPSLSANIGDACDDGNPNTENDVVTSSCSCLGAPLNDLCSNATPLTINAAGNCPANQVVGTTSGANSEYPDACESSMSDVYYSVTTNDSQESISIDLTKITAADLVLSIFEGSCSAESDFCYFNPETSVIYAVNPNTTYYIRVHSFFIVNTGTFNICVQEVYDCPSLSANIGDACDDSDATTGNDTVTPACTCEGTPISFASVGGTVTGWNTDCSDRALTLSLFGAFEGINYFNLAGTLHSDGSFDLAGAPNILPGDYHVLIKVEGALTQALFNVEIESGVNSLNFDPLILGDLNDDNTISVFDFSEMNPAFGTSLGDADYNPNADLNCDGLINVFDVSILNTNYGATGESII